MTGEQLALTSIAELAPLVRGREVSPVEIVEATLTRIQRLGPTLNCYLTVCSEQAREQAVRLERRLAAGEWLGPLHGISVSLKDNIETAGVLTTAGSPILRQWIPKRDATSIALLRSHGAVLVGKCNLYEFAYGAPNPTYGPTRNPWNLEHSCGGSSSGSAAAVAAGLCHASLGTDTGGSIRIPSAFCGVVGLKPTYGRVSRAGVIPVSYNLDHVGPITRTVHDAALVLAALSGPDPRDPTAARRQSDDFTSELEEGVAGLRLGVCAARQLEGAEAEARDAFERACAILEGKGATLREVELPDLDEARTLMWAISAAEAADYHRSWLREHGEAYHPVVRSLLEVGEFLPAVDYVRAQRVRRRVCEELGQLLDGLDALLIPAVPVSAYRIGQRALTVADVEEDVLRVITRFTPLFNLTGNPALVLPCAFSVAGLPLGLQIVGRPFAEARVFRIARAFERAGGWQRMPPDPPLLDMQEYSTATESTRSPGP